MLDGNYSGLVEFAGDTDSCISIFDVVVGQFFSVQLDRARDRERYSQWFLVESRCLVAVFSVTQALFQIISHCQFFRFGFADHIGQVLGDQSIVAGCMTEHFCSQSLACFESRFAGSFQFGKDFFIVDRIGQNSYARVVLSRAAEHAWAADVDVFDGISQSHIVFADGFFEWVQVDDNEIDRCNIVLFHGLHMVRKITSAQKSAMDQWVQRFYAAVHHFRKAGYILYGNSRYASLFQSFLRSAS